MRQVLGDSAFPHPLSIVRLVFPDTPELATPPHQDYPNNQGTENLTAAWIPLDDCSVSDGALAILEGSHKFGLFPRQFHLGPGNRGAILSDCSSRLPLVVRRFQGGGYCAFPGIDGAPRSGEPQPRKNAPVGRFSLSTRGREAHGWLPGAAFCAAQLGRRYTGTGIPGSTSTTGGTSTMSRYPGMSRYRTLPEEHLSEALAPGDRF